MNLAVRCALLLAAFLSEPIDCIRAASPTLLIVQAVQSQEGSVTGKICKAWSSLVSQLWSQLIIEQARKPIDFDKSDKAVKDKFVSDCVITMDVHEVAIDTVDAIVKNMCKEARGTPSECKDMTTTLWQARKEKKLKLWCDKTFKWFAVKTKPRCLTNCGAFLCKDRCAQQDEIEDLADQIEAYEIEMNTTLSKEKRLRKFAEESRSMLDKIVKLDESECVPAHANVSKLQSSRASVAKEFDRLVKAADAAGLAKDKAFEKLKKLRADKNAMKNDISTAAEAYTAASTAFQEAKYKQSWKNRSLRDATAILEKARRTLQLKCDKIDQMNAEYDKAVKANDAAIKSVAEQKENVRVAMDKVLAEKSKLEYLLSTALKAK